MTAGNFATTARIIADVDGAITRVPQDKWFESIDVADFGAVGDGITDDTAALQSAFNSGEKLKSRRGKTYLVSRAGSKTCLGSEYFYSLLMPEGLCLDFSGSTIKLDDGENCSILMNSNAQDGGTVQSGYDIQGLVLDGNRDNQTTAESGEISCMHLRNISDSTIQVKAIEAKEYAFRVMSAQRMIFPLLEAYGSDERGIALGYSAGGEHLLDSIIFSMIARDCAGNTIPGNGILLDVQRCIVHSIFQENCHAGVKIQNSSADSTFGQIINLGGELGSANSGVKIQGNSGAGLKPRGITIGQIIARDQASEGLYTSETEDVSIGSYYGYNNGITNTSSDFRAATGSGGMHIATFISENAGGYGALISAGDVNIGLARVKEPGLLRCIQVQGTGRAYFGHVNGSGTNLARVLSLTDTTTLGRANLVSSSTSGAVNSNASSGFTIVEEQLTA